MTDALLKPTRGLGYRRKMRTAAPKHRLTSFRGWMPFSAPRSPRYVRELWARRFSESGNGHPFWMHVHIPYCPQRCTFCQCSTSLLDRPATLETYLEWLESEIEFMSEASRSGRVRIQYIGGGTPNILSNAQLCRLFECLERNFSYEHGARRTFEFLPSTLRPGTIALARRFGFNRLSCGVQSVDDPTLSLHKRAPDRLDSLRSTFEEAYALGYDEINCDLIFGLTSERRQNVERDIAALASLRPTTITLHIVIPTPQFPVYSSLEEEIARHAEFRGLSESMAEWTREYAPDYEWVYRPNTWVLVHREFLNGPLWKPWYYSDNERIPLDMLGLGRFAHSHIVGRCFYETVRLPGAYDPDAPFHKAFEFEPLVDAGLDLITGLVGDRVADLNAIRARYRGAPLDALKRSIAELARRGVVSVEDGRVVMHGDDHIFVDQLDELRQTMLDAAATVHGDQLPRRGRTPLLRARVGDAAIHVHSERAQPGRRYYGVVGPFGISYSVETSSEPVPALIEAFMARIMEAAEAFVAAERHRDAIDLQKHLIGMFARGPDATTPED